MIQMTGTDHTMAPVEIRSIFSFTKSEQAHFMPILRERLHADGIVFINTCNRTEIWADTDAQPVEMVAELCRIREVPFEKYHEIFHSRSGEDAVQHLFYLSCGLESAILAEDQILTQVKEALAFARSVNMTDGLLEVLFRTAITAAKKVKTEVTFTRADSTAIGQAIKLLREKNLFSRHSRCMVIGNGQYGRLAASELLKAGGDVLVTVRQYHKGGHVEVPHGTRRTFYDDRYFHLPECDIVVSATTSPHHTITREDLEKIPLTKPIVFYDLAVPADIDPEIAKLPNVTLYNIDDFRTDPSTLNEGAFRKAGMILKKYMREFQEYRETKDILPLLRSIQEAGVHDFHQRIHRILRKLPIEKEDRANLSHQIDTACEKTIRKLLFDLYDYVDTDQYLAAIEGMGKIYE